MSDKLVDNTNISTQPKLKSAVFDSAIDAAAPPTSKGAPPVYSTAQFTRNGSTAPPPPRESLARERSRQRTSYRSRRRNEWAWVILAGGLISVFGVLILAMIVLIRVPQSTQVAIPTADLTPVLPTPVDARSEFVADGKRVGVDVLQLDDGSLIALQPWDGQSRYTIIVGGLDRRPDHDQPPLLALTDTLMLISIEPRSKSVGVLSIPRDLWVEIPGADERHRINRANFIGELRNTGGGGPQLLQQTISSNFGLRVHNYALVDFTAVTEIVDHLGGIEVTIDYVISDDRFPDMNYGYDPFYLPPGTHLLNGYDALRFARTRHGNNDVLRAGRQQQLLYGIRDRALGLDFLQLVTQVPAVLQSLSDNIYTGLTLQEIIQLALFSRDIDLANITMRVMDFNYLQEYLTEDEQQVLVPIQARLSGLLEETFGEDYQGWRN